jgi:hypothetical protein
MEENKMQKVKVYSIVFIQSQDDLSHYDSNVYSADDLDTEFLGYKWDDSKEDEGYLLSRNDNLNYIGLSYFKTVGGVPK